MRSRGVGPSLNSAGVWEICLFSAGGREICLFSAGVREFFLFSAGVPEIWVICVRDYSMLIRGIRVLLSLLWALRHNEFVCLNCIWPLDSSRDTASRNLMVPS